MKKYTYAELAKMSQETLSEVFGEEFDRMVYNNFEFDCWLDTFTGYTKAQIWRFTETDREEVWREWLINCAETIQDTRSLMGGNFNRL